jgi:hypothetical protein
VKPLTELRNIAEAADNGASWEWDHAYPQRITRVGDVTLVADCFEDPDNYRVAGPSRFAEFIATFDPPTVLALLEAKEALERVANGTYMPLGGAYISPREFARRFLRDE